VFVLTRAAGNPSRAFLFVHFPRTIRLSILLLVLGCTAGCDQTSKHFARSALNHFGSVTLPGGFAELRLAENPGSFLSLGDSLPKSLRMALFTVGTGVCLLGLFAYLVHTRIGRCNFIGLALIWAGGTSNLIDRIARQGLVTDFAFIRVGPFHTGIFNVADVMVLLGLAVLLRGYWKRRQAGVAPARAEVLPD
jgi:signal peptidase II